MKKSLIGAIVGGIIIFIWQFLSWAIINLHLPAQQYSPKQDAVMAALNSNLEEGGYFVPSLPETATMEEQEQAMKDMEGKPWATIQYHKAMENKMTMNMIRGALVNMVTVWLLCWILLRLAKINFGTVFTASLFIGFIVFLNAHYTNHIWYETFDLMAHFVDAVVAWGACGLWLGWWLSKNGTRHQLAGRSVSNVEHLNV